MSATDFAAEVVEAVPKTKACRINLDRPSGYDGVVDARPVPESLLAVLFLEAHQHGQARENCEGSKAE